ncbi:MAG: hypothetical protein ACTHOK_08190 [Nocardioidaceae bacterium]
MAQDQKQDVRAGILELLLRKVEEDRYPSSTMLNMIEELLTPADVPRYAQMLMAKIADDDFPSVPMLARLKKLA